MTRNQSPQLQLSRTGQWYTAEADRLLAEAADMVTDQDSSLTLADRYTLCFAMAAKMASFGSGFSAAMQPRPLDEYDENVTAFLNLLKHVLVRPT